MFFFQLLPPEKCALTNHQKGKYKPQIVALAEGLAALNLEVGGNIDYYAVSKVFLIPRKTFDVTRVRCLVVASDILFDCDVPTVERIATCRKRGVPVVAMDWIASRFFGANRQLLLSRCDVYLFYSYVPELANVTKVKPWPIGFTERVVRACSLAWLPFEQRRSAVLWSHRVPHHIRKAVWDTFYGLLALDVERFHDGFRQPDSLTEYDNMMNLQTGNRHNPRFYEQLCSVKMVDCCGGFFRGNVIRQWDSYKLWEGFVAGCCVITLDLEYYGFATGATAEPKNMTHYVGLRLDQPEYMRRLACDLCGGRINIADIAANGKAWAMEHFHPIARAKTFLELLNAAKPQCQTPSHSSH